MVRLSVYMRYEDVDRGVALADSAIMLSRNTDDLDGLHNAYTAKANALQILIAQGKGPWSDDSVIVLHEKALRIAASIEDTLGMSIAHFNLGSVYSSRNPFIALEHELEGFRLQREPNDLAQHSCYSTMADCYGRLGQRDESLNYGRLAVEAADRSGKKSIRVISRMSLGEALMEDGRDDSALVVFQEIKGISRSVHAAGGMWRGIARARRAKGDVAGCLMALDSAMVKFSDGSVPPAMRWVHAIRAEAASSLGKADEARREIGAYDLLIGEYMEPGDRSETYLNLSKAFSNLHEPSKALAMLRMHMELEDSIAFNRNSSLIAAAQEAFGAKEKDTSIAQLKLERKVQDLRMEKIDRERAWIIGISAFLILLGFMSYKFEQKRRLARYEKDAAQLETQALRSQMNPHFIFNALNSISAYVQKNEPDKAVGYLGKFARLMRLVLENSRQSEVPLKDDLEALDAYLHLERARGGEKFDYTITVDPAIDQEDTLVPPLVIQPFVENAIWHGMAGKEGKGHITLSVTRRADELIMAIEDDGVGRHAPKKMVEGEPVKKTSLATTITQARLDLVQKQKGRPAGFKYIDLPQGTRVEVSLPISEAA